MDAIQHLSNRLDRYRTHLEECHTCATASATTHWKCSQGSFLAYRVVGGSQLIAIRLGTVEGDPEIEPSWHAWVSSAPDWYPIPEDGLPRYPEGRPARP